MAHWVLSTVYLLRNRVVSTYYGTFAMIHTNSNTVQVELKRSHRGDRRLLWVMGSRRNKRIDHIVSNSDVIELDGCETIGRTVVRHSRLLWATIIDHGDTTRLC